MHFRERTVHAQRTTVSGDLKNSYDGLLEDSSVLLFRLPKRLCRTLPFRDIPRHFGRPNNTACAIFHGRNSKGEIERRSVLAKADSFEIFDLIASLDPLKNRCFFVSAIWGNDKGNVPANGFLGCVAEHLFRAFIPTGDNPL